MNEPVEAVVAAIGRALPWPGTAGVIGLPEPPEGAIALLLAAWAATGGGRTVLHVARSETRAERLARAARSFAPDVKVRLLPPWDCLPYDRASPSRAVMGRRVAVLSELAERAPGAPRLVITTVDALLQRLPPRAAWAGSRLRLEPGCALDELRVWLIRAGYVLEERVDEPGEAAIRGEIVEVFPADAEEPVRLELDDGRIRRFRRYDPVNQRTIADVEALDLRPASEVILSAEAVESFMADSEAAPPGGPLVGPAEAPRRAAGLEHRLALWYEKLETLFDYVPDALLSLDPEVEERRDAWLAQVADGYDIRRALQRNGNAAGAQESAPLEPRRLWLDEAEWRERLAPRMVVTFRADEPGSPAVGARPLPRLADAASPVRALADHVAERSRAGDRVLLTAREEDGRRRLARLAASRLGADVAALERWTEILGLAPGVVATAALDLTSGFALPGLTVIAAADAGLQEARPSDPRPALADGVFVSGELRPGDLVVHADHGIGRLRGLELIAEDDVPVECLSLEYAGGRKLLVPAVELDRIWRYGSEAAEVGLDRLGADDWRKRASEVEAEVEAAAARLAQLAHERQRARAPEIRAAKAPYRRFVARFPFTETADQQRAIEATLADLARGAPPLDRLVCGDVGFGKTEVALRAAFAAATSGKQVALIAPTTVLVRQHLETFRRRFAGFDLRIEQLSRLASDAEARAVRAGLADGSVRIVIGTQALASPKVRFSDLGLVIVDEEQRFGAREKTRLRALGQGVHVLTLTATPIPRTLQAALAGLLDLSVIATPPVRRRPVRTFVAPFDPVVVREVLRREHQRGGQSFLVCPRIRDLQPMAERLAAILPELDVVIAHGRMKGALLDELMVRFAAGAHDVLLTTDIIESGLDLPNANTILIWRADRFGLAQLHQLRGRVGRGARQASAYLLTDPGTRLSDATGQRLRTLEALEGLGAGFEIGARDLDLRGAGDLLGLEQAGHMRLIGTELYQRMLGRALQRARGKTLPEEGAIELNFGMPLLIPADYVPEPEIRLALYRQLGALPDEAAVAAFGEELVDRFGPLPGALAALLARAGLLLRCRRAGIARLEAGPKAIALEFRAPEALRRCAVLAGDDGQVRLSGHRLIASEETASPEARLEAARRLLERVEELTGGPAS